MWTGASDSVRSGQCQPGLVNTTTPSCARDYRKFLLAKTWMAEQPYVAGRGIILKPFVSAAQGHSREWLPCIFASSTAYLQVVLYICRSKVLRYKPPLPHLGPMPTNPRKHDAMRCVVISELVRVRGGVASNSARMIDCLNRSHEILSIA